MAADSIDYLISQLRDEFGLSPVLGGEIECYIMLADESAREMDRFWEPVEKAFQHEGLPILRIEKERGWNQYEVVTRPMRATDLAYCLARVRAIIEKYAARMHVATSFAGKPFADQPSSGIHIHLHLADGEGLNAFHKTEEGMSLALRYSLGGLLHALAADMPIFFPLKLIMRALMTPTMCRKSMAGG